MEDQLEKIDSDSNASIEDKIKAYEKIAEELIDECDANKIVAFMTHGGRRRFRWRTYFFIFKISHSHLFNKLQIQPTYMHKYSRSHH